jgi:AmiR/NasT family two-component response regulator
MPERPTSRTTPKILADLRTLRVLVYHPDDDNGRLVLEQLNRIGCQTARQWPPVPVLPQATDLIFLAVRPEILGCAPAWLDSENRPPLIAIVTYESPTILEFLLRIDAEGTVSTPVRSFGLLTAMAISCHQHAGKNENRRRIRQLENRMLSMRTLNEAKTLLMTAQDISEEDAYKHIRRLSMEQRRSLQDIAEQVIQAYALLKPKG